MNLAGVLCPKPWISNFLLAGFLLFPANAQITQKTGAAEQTSFSMEFPFERPVPLSEAAKKTLATDQGIADVMKDDQLSIESIPKDWFTAAEVHLGPTSETDLVVMGLGISLGPNSAGFWVLRQTPQGYEIVLAVNTHDLALLDSRTNGFRDIETNLPTLNQSDSDTYRFDGHRYQISPAKQDSQSARASDGAAPAAPVMREEQRVLVNGKLEAWRLEWKSTPKSVCGLEDILSASTCPCSGFTYGESGQLDLVRSTNGRETERLELAPFFEEVFADQGGAILQRWEPQEKDFEEQQSKAFLAQVRARPIVKVMRFADYNHDGNSTEFFLQTGVEPCGKVSGIVVGVTAERPRLHAFETAAHPDKPLVMQKREWEALRKSLGPTEVLDWPCGDHGSEIESDLVLSAANGRIQAIRREFECTEKGNRGKLLREHIL